MMRTLWEERVDIQSHKRGQARRTKMKAWCAHAFLGQPRGSRADWEIVKFTLITLSKPIRTYRPKRWPRCTPLPAGNE